VLHVKFTDNSGWLKLDNCMYNITLERCPQMTTYSILSVDLGRVRSSTRYPWINSSLATVELTGQPRVTRQISDSARKAAAMFRVRTTSGVLGGRIRRVTLGSYCLGRIACLVDLRGNTNDGDIA
jgi:hypothetical protein